MKGGDGENVCSACIVMKLKKCVYTVHRWKIQTCLVCRAAEVESYIGQLL